MSDSLNQITWHESDDDGVLSDQSTSEPQEREMELDLDESLLRLGAFGKRKKKDSSDSETETNPRRPPKTPNIEISSPSRSQIGNHSLNSTPGLTFIIKPLDSNSNPSFCKNPVKLAKSLKEEPFCKMNKKNVRINQRRNLIAVEVENISDTLKASVLAVKTFAGVNVTIYVPKSETEIMGVIGPIDVSVDTEDLFDLLKCSPDSKVIKITRLNKFTNGSRTPSAAIRLTFEGNTLPNSVSIDFMTYKVRPYNTGPLRCYNCQLFGHAAGGCTRTRRCVHCSGNHTPDACPENSPANCANCKGPHRASSSDCPTYKKYDALVKNRTTKITQNKISITNDTALTPALSQTTPSFDFHNTQGSYFESSSIVPAVQCSYSNAVKKNKSTENHDILKTLSDVQKNIIKELSETIEKKQNELKNLIVNQIEEKIKENNIIIANCIYDFAIQTSASKKIDKKQITKIIVEHFGSSVGKGLTGKCSAIRSSGRSRSNISSNKQS